MLIKLLYFTYLVKTFVYVEANIVMVSMTPDDIYQTFKSFFKEDLVHRLSQEIVNKTMYKVNREIKKKSSNTINEIVNKEKEKAGIYDENFVRFIEDEENLPVWESRSPNGREPSVEVQNKEDVEDHVLNKNEVIKFLDDPSTDGDNLENESGNLTKEEVDKEKEVIPVIKKMKVNGIYYRRLLGILRSLN